MEMALLLNSAVFPCNTENERPPALTQATIWLLYLVSVEELLDCDIFRAVLLPFEQMARDWNRED